ncbi:MAG: hypothetical protein E2P03_09370 [Acidobacteria bacterium]|nr:MAG: hypothetical protein E2P03_09370 [Acidobacteriota bacterium]
MKSMKNIAGIIGFAVVLSILVTPVVSAGVIGSDGSYNTESIGVIGSDGSYNAESIGVIGSDGSYNTESIGVIGSDGNNHSESIGVIGSDGSYAIQVGGEGLWSVAFAVSPRLAAALARMGLI